MGTERKAARASSTGARARRDSGASGFADALFTATQQRVLGLLFGQPERSFSVTELIRLARSGSGAVQRELDRLSRAGIVTVDLAGGRKHVQANHATPIFEELRGLVEKTTGVAEQLRKALENRADRVPLAVLFGSVAKQTDVSSSDIDVLIVSDDLTQEDAFALFEEAEARLGRRVNPTIYTPEEFERRRRSHNPFVENVLTGRHVVLAGRLDDLTA
jgi:predicted nucleotidyltransferase